LPFLYNEVLEKKIGLIQGVVRANRPKRLPVVLTKEEVRRILDNLENVPWLMAMLLYGSQPRGAVLRPRRATSYSDPYSLCRLESRSGYGENRYLSLLADNNSKSRSPEDLKRGLGRVALPDALERKYPTAGLEIEGEFGHL
jgi:hypothetical protein